MKKDFLKEQDAHRKVRSAYYRRRYMETRDMAIIGDMWRENHFLVREPWVVAELMRSLSHGNRGAFKAFEPKPGERANRLQYKAESIRIVDAVNDLVAAGTTFTDKAGKVYKGKEAAFRKIVAGTSTNDGGWGVIKNRYYRHRNWKADIYVREFPDHYLIVVGPTRIENPSDSGPMEVSIVHSGERVEINMTAAPGRKVARTVCLEDINPDSVKPGEIISVKMQRRKYEFWEARFPRLTRNDPI